MWEGDCWRSEGELISNVLLLTFMHAHTSVDRLEKNYIRQSYADRGYSVEDLPEAMDDWDRLRERQGQDTEIKKVKGFPFDLMMMMMMMMKL